MAVSRVPICEFICTIFLIVIGNSPISNAGKIEFDIFPGIRHQEMISSVTPTGLLLQWDFRKTKEDYFVSKTNNLLSQIDSLLLRVSETKELTDETVLKPLITYDQLSTQALLVFLGQTLAADLDTREMISRIGKGVSARLDSLEAKYGDTVYNKLVEYYNKKDETKHLDIELKRALDKLIQKKRQGKGCLSVKNLSQFCSNINKIESAMSLNITNDNRVIPFPAANLSWMDEGFLKNVYNTNTKVYEIDLKTTNYDKVMTYCNNPETRKTLHLAYHSRAAGPNGMLIATLVDQRSIYAKGLGFSSHAEYVQEFLMMRTPENVKQFLEELTKRVSGPWKKMLSQMQELKQKDIEEGKYSILSETNEIKMWDYQYYFQLMTSNEYTLPPNLHEYFPLKSVLEGMFDIYQNLLGLEFIPQPNAEVWDDNVAVYQVKDNNGGEVLGYFYLDLFTREGKGVGAYTVTMERGCLDDKGNRLTTAVAISENLPLPTEESPALLSHSAVKDIFHEFGHAMHAMCGRTKTSLFHGTQVEADFVEAPSQMLENWCYDKASLKKMSSHYKTGEKLPDNIIDNLVNARKVNGIDDLVLTLTKAIVDQRIHGSDLNQKTALQHCKEAFKEILGIEVAPGTNPLANFHHIFEGYDASYYGYLITQVYAQDMFDEKFKLDPFNKKAGMEYRKFILSPGGSVSGGEMLKSFLGREYKIQPFLESIGLS